LLDAMSRKALHNYMLLVWISTGIRAGHKHSGLFIWTAVTNKGCGQ